LGTLSAPRFRSVLSHWIYHCESERLYAMRGRPKNPLPGRPLFSRNSAFTKLHREIDTSTPTGVASPRLSALFFLFTGLSQRRPDTADSHSRISATAHFRSSR